MALPKGKKTVIDNLSGWPVDAKAIDNAIAASVARRKDPSHYSVEREGDRIVVRSPDPIAATHAAGPQGLPPNVLKCPFCSFTTGPTESESRLSRR